MTLSDYNLNVFINCPFDDDYKPLFKALVFTIYDCGYKARCSLESIDSSQNRIDRIFNLIKDCRCGIHDISRTELDPESNLPRFNMPLELGIFLGAKQFGNKHQQKKNCLILDKNKYHYQQFCSDISGHDIETHDNHVEKLITAVRNWLQSITPDKNIDIPSGSIICNRFYRFKKVLPEICDHRNLNSNELTFNDLIDIVKEWLDENSL